MSHTVKIAGIKFDIDTARTLEWVGHGAHEVADDVTALREGHMSADELLERCLEGAEDNAADWRDYVRTVVRYILWGNAE